MIKIISTDGKGNIKKEIVSDSNTNKAIKAIGDNFRQWLRDTTPQEVKDTNPKWKLGK